MTASKGVGRGHGSGGPNGGGRPRGARNKRTLVQIAEVERTGPTPLAFLLAHMRDPTAEMRERLYAASAALPYVHSKLFALRVLPTNPERLSDLALATKLTRLKRDTAPRSEGARVAAVNSGLKRLLEEIGRLRPGKQRELLGKLLASIEEAVQGIDPNPPGTVLPHANGSGPAAGPVARPITRPTRR